MNKIIEHDISLINDDFFLQTHSTNPLITTTTINKAIQYFFNHTHKFNSVFSVTKWQTRLFWFNGKAVNHDPNNLVRTQDLPPLFEENSNLYLFSRNSFLESGNKRIGTKPGMFEVGRLESIDIDEPEDFIIAETLYKKYNSINGQS